MKKTIPKRVYTCLVSEAFAENESNYVTATNVPGRKTIVNAAIVFMASLSRLVSKAILLEASAIAMFVRLSFWEMRFAAFNTVRQQH